VHYKLFKKGRYIILFSLLFSIAIIIISDMKAKLVSEAMQSH